MPDRQTIRTHAIAVALVSWTLLIWTQALPGAFDRFGTLRGVDFLQFYAAGRLVLEGLGAGLYDWDRFAAMVRAAAPAGADAQYLPVYPPHVALWFAPFSAFPYLGALGLWVAVSAALYGLSAWLLWRHTPALRPYGAEAAMLALAFPPFLQLLAHGQAAAPALVLLTASWLAYRGGYPFVSGLALGGMLYKPQFALFPGLTVLLLPGTRVRTVAGVAAAATVQTAVIGLVLGPVLPLEYLGSLMRAASMADVFEPRPWQMHGLGGALVLLIGRGWQTTVALVLGSVVIVGSIARSVREQSSPEIRFALLCIGALVLNPHLYAYDLVLLIVPLALLGGWLIRGSHPDQSTIAWLAYALTWVSLVAPLAQLTRVQLTTPLALALILVLRQRVSGQPRPTPAELEGVLLRNTANQKASSP